MACEAPCFEVGATSVFPYWTTCFFRLIVSVDFIIDIHSTFLQSFTPVCKAQLTRCKQSFATVLFLFFLNRMKLFFLSHSILLSLDFIIHVQSIFLQTFTPVLTELCHRILSVSPHISVSKYSNPNEDLHFSRIFRPVDSRCLNSASMLKVVFGYLYIESSFWISCNMMSVMRRLGSQLRE